MKSAFYLFPVPVLVLVPAPAPVLVPAPKMHLHRAIVVTGGKRFSNLSYNTRPCFGWKRAMCILHGFDLVKIGCFDGKIIGNVKRDILPESLKRCAESWVL